LQHGVILLWMREDNKLVDVGALHERGVENTADARFFFYFSSF
jgi:hypothetical protein